MSSSRTFQKGNFIAALVTIGTCDVAFGLTLQLQPLLMEQMRLTAWMMGAIIAMGPLGILLAGPLLPDVIARHGGKKIAIAAMVAILVCLALFPFLPPLYWWFPLRFVLGMAIGTLFTVSEMWMLTVADDSNRGRIMGIYTSMLSVTFAVGPLILPFTGIDGLLPWLICMGFVAAAFLPMIFVGVRDVAKDEGEGSYSKVILAAPLLFLCVATATLFDSVMMSFFTIFAMRNGVPLETASQALGVSIIVGVGFFYPLGLWADRWSKAGVIAVCAVATIVAALALIPYVATWAIWPLTAIMACAGFGVYVVALALIGDLFKGKDMIAASAAVAGMWGVGGMIGPPLAGKIIDVAGINAFGFVVAAFYAVLLVVLALARGRFMVARA